MERSRGWRLRRGVVLLALASMTLLVVGMLAPAAQARVERFQSLAPSPGDLTAVAADPVTGLIYGQENGGNKFFVYDPRTDVWSELAPSPIYSGNNGGATYLDGKIYTSYTGNNELGVYDIATDSWTIASNPRGYTGDITAGNGKLFLAGGSEFVQYDPATGIATPLAEPPAFAPSCENFQAWGGLQFDGDKIYGHQGNGCTGFAVYDIAGDSWAELTVAPAVASISGGEPEGPVLGSALYPTTDTYLTYGPYEGDTLFRYDIEAGTWSTSTLKFGENSEINDGGMAYIATPGYEGVYMVEGESGTGFGRYTEQNATDLSTSMSAQVVASQTGGEITYSIQVKNDGPERAGGVVLSDSLPAGTTPVSASASQGTCTGSISVSCALGVLRSGGTASVTIKVTAGSGSVTNTAKVSSQALDTNPGNDSASVASTLATPATPSAAPPAVACVVPKLDGRKLRAAKRVLLKRHCKPGKVTHRSNNKVNKGRVIGAAKKVGKSLPAGTRVKLTVSSGPKAHEAQHKH